MRGKNGKGEVIYKTRETRGGGTEGQAWRALERGADAFRESRVRPNWEGGENRKRGD